MPERDRVRLELELEIDSDEDVRLLRGALLAAQATELSEVQRRAGRHALGYGDEAGRESMSAEALHHRRRHELLGRLLAALDAAAPDRA